MPDYDFLIVGAGAGGSAVARTLAKTGKTVLILERGGRLPIEEENWSPDAIVSEGRYRTDELWLDGDDADLNPHAYYNVGGNTKVYGSVLQRMREKDFEDLPVKEGLSPGWPISYDDIEPFYCLAERMYMIHAGDEDPTEPRRSEPYPFGPFEHEPYIQARADELEKLGLTPIHNPLSLNRDEDNPDARPCIRCQTCDPFPCKLHAKCDAETVGINPALVEGEGRVELWEHAKVLRLLPDATGRRTRGVLVERDGGEATEVTADQVILSCGAINSAGLMLRSACEQWPAGAGNGNDLVGRGLMKHNHSALLAIGYEPNETIFQKTLAFHDYYFGSPEHAYPLGTVQLTGKAPWQRLKLFSDGPMPEEILKHHAKHCINWWMTSEDLPVPENRVTITADGRQKVAFRPTNMGAHHDLLAIWQKRLRECGFDRFWLKTMGLEVVWHQAGTCVMGDDPATSVLDSDCRSHEIENLLVVDSAFMPSMGATNLTLTIVANALRVAAKLAGKPLELPRQQPADTTLQLMELSIAGRALSPA